MAAGGRPWVAAVTAVDRRQGNRPVGSGVKHLHTQTKLYKYEDKTTSTHAQKSRYFTKIFVGNLVCFTVFYLHWQKVGVQNISDLDPENSARGQMKKMTTHVTNYELLIEHKWLIINY